MSSAIEEQTVEMNFEKFLIKQGIVQNDSPISEGPTLKRIDLNEILGSEPTTQEIALNQEEDEPTTEFNLKNGLVGVVGKETIKKIKFIAYSVKRGLIPMGVFSWTAGKKCTEDDIITVGVELSDPQINYILNLIQQNLNQKIKMAALAEKRAEKSVFYALKAFGNNPNYTYNYDCRGVKKILNSGKLFTWGELTIIEREFKKRNIIF